MLVLRFLSLLQLLMLIFNNTGMYRYNDFSNFQTFFVDLQRISDLSYFASNIKTFDPSLVLLGIITLYFGLLVFLIVRSTVMIKSASESSRFILFCSAITNIHTEILFYPLVQSLAWIEEQGCLDISSEIGSWLHADILELDLSF